MKDYLVIFERGENNWSAYVPDLPGCVAAADTREETARLIQEAIEFHIEGLKAHSEPVPEPTTEAQRIRPRRLDMEELREKRDEILKIAAHRGASNVRVFGSVARGDTRPESDVDFLVDLEKGRSLLDHAGLQVDLEEYLGANVDVVTSGGLKDRIRDRILKEAVAL